MVFVVRSIKGNPIVYMPDNLPHSLKYIIALLVGAQRRELFNLSARGGILGAEAPREWHQGYKPADGLWDSLDYAFQAA